jgi:hypothetical protein
MILNKRRQIAQELKVSNKYCAWRAKIYARKKLRQFITTKPDALGGNPAGV